MTDLDGPADLQRAPRFRARLARAHAPEIAEPGDGEIARHILEASEGLTGLLLAGDENFATPDFRKKMARHIGSLPANAPSADLPTFADGLELARLMEAAKSSARDRRTVALSEIV